MTICAGTSFNSLNSYVHQASIVIGIKLVEISTENGDFSPCRAPAVFLLQRSLDGNPIGVFAEQSGGVGPATAAVGRHHFGIRRL